MKRVYLYKSHRKGKKWAATIVDGGRTETVHFGAAGYEDYTQHGDRDRKASYLARHRRRENWGKSGIATAGFWSRWLLWNKPTIHGSARDIAARFGVRVSHAKPPS